MDKLTGIVVNKKSIAGTLQVPSKIPVHDKYEDYEGTYDVKPTISAQTLPTKKRSMENDLTIEAINYAEVDNPGGGKTVTIGYV